MLFTVWGKMISLPAYRALGHLFEASPGANRHLVLVMICPLGSMCTAPLEVHISV